MTLRLALILVLSFAGTAIADPRKIELSPVCAEVAADHLRNEASRAAARRLLVRTLEREDLLVVDTGCVETIRLRHDQRDGSVIVWIESPRGHLARSAKLSELPDVYRALVRSLLATPMPVLLRPMERSAIAPPASAGDQPDNRTAADPAPTGPRIVERAPRWVPGMSAPPAPFPVRAEPADNESSPPDSADGMPSRRGLWYLRLGGAGAAGLGTGAAMAAGYRKLIDSSYAIDVSLSTLNGELGSSVAGSVDLLWYATPSETAPYLGGGLSAASAQRKDALDGGGGLGADLVTGVAFARRSPLQLFVQVEVGVPFFSLPNSDTPVSLSGSFGVAFRR